MDDASHTALLLHNGVQQAQEDAWNSPPIPSTEPAQWNILTGPAALGSQLHTPASVSSTGIPE